MASATPCPLFVRDTPFLYGVLPFSSLGKLGSPVLMTLMSETKNGEGNEECFLSFSAWRKWAFANCKLTPDEAWICFETFDLVATEDKQRRDRFLRLCMPNSETSDRDLVSVNANEFIVFLVIQKFRHVALRTSVLTERASPEFKRGSLEDESSVMDSKRLQFIKDCMDDILKILSIPSNHRIMSLPALNALELCLHVKGEKNLANLARSKEHASLSGYSSTVQSFSLAKLNIWLRTYLSGQSRSDAEERLEFSSLNKKLVLLEPHRVNQKEIVITNCSSSAFYIFGALRNVKIHGCKGITVVLSAVQGTVSFARCRRATIVSACRRITFGSCVDCTSQLWTATYPLVFEGCQSISIGPFGSLYPEMLSHFEMTGLSDISNVWHKKKLIGTWKDKDQNRTKRAASLTSDADYFPFFIPFYGSAMPISEEALVRLPENYASEVKQKLRKVTSFREKLRAPDLEHELLIKFAGYMNSQFSEWLQETGNMRYIAELTYPETDTHT
eukprot:m.67039 g.67039  ORF g.67039 m.67039 type:complete len:502 (+) comp11853_c0_seq4:418-1923(+)